MYESSEVADQTSPSKRQRRRPAGGNTKHIERAQTLTSLPWFDAVKELRIIQRDGSVVLEHPRETVDVLKLSECGTP